ncbi:AHH domain-containing protein, partial [Bacillus sp. NH11B]|uniref:AHH domain-containing protein n=1 Tax=Bacillus sp. NH11B TaxID=1866314 RepID=UPI000AFBDB59
GYVEKALTDPYALGGAIFDIGSCFVGVGEVTAAVKGTAAFGKFAEGTKVFQVAAKNSKIVGKLEEVTAFMNKLPDSMKNVVEKIKNIEIPNLFPEPALAGGGNVGERKTLGELFSAVNSGTRGTGNTVSDYLDDIIVNGNVDAAKMNKLKNAIQNNTFSKEELAEISKKMSDLGITKEYNEALLKIVFGKYLRGLIGDPPTDMRNPHAHHILFKKGLGQEQKELVQEGQEILRRYGIDPIIGEENLVWAPNAVVGQHSFDALEIVVKRLRDVEAMDGDLDDIVEALKDLGDIASTR